MSIENLNLWEDSKRTREIDNLVEQELVELGLENKKILTDNAGKQIRKNLNIANRDEYVWTKIRERYINADVNALGDFIKSF